MSNSKTNERRHRKSSDRSCSDSSKSDSDREDCECLKTKDFNEVYKYYKYLLQTDPGLMISGSQGYATATNTLSEIVPQNFPITLENLILSHNVDHLNFYSPYHVRQSGIYLYLFAVTTDQACQITLFVNGIVQYLDRVGTNSGAGQLLLRGMLNLNNGDSLVIRNNVTSTPTFTSNLNVGGTLIGNPSTFMLYMISPLKPTTLDDDFDLECLKKRELRLFKKLSCRLEQDCEIFLRGFNKYGVFYTQSAQTVLVGADIVWDNYKNLNGLTWSAASPANIVILEEGLYEIMTVLNTDVAAQITLCINNTPNVDTTQGLNKTGQMSMRTLKQLYKNDVVTVRNNISTTAFNIVANSGGLNNDNGITIEFVRIGPVVPIVPVNCSKLNYCKKHLYKNLYKKFVNYLLAQCEYMIAGSASYISTMSDTLQEIPLSASVEWNINNIKRDISFITGTTEVKIRRSGMYSVSFDILTNEPSQYTVFINGVQDLTKTSVSISGASRLIMKQILKLHDDDIISIRNYTSNGGIVHTGLNAGGVEVEKNRTLVLFLLSPTNKHHPCRSMRSTHTKHSLRALDLDKKVFTEY